jgi:hypothetical protein
MYPLWLVLTRQRVGQIIMSTLDIKLEDEICH